MQQHLSVFATHISVIAHITQRELAHHLHGTEAQNGFANRCLWAWVHRSNCLPDGGSLSVADLAPLLADSATLSTGPPRPPKFSSNVMLRHAISGANAIPS
jgi:hypothetical protein